MLFLLSFLFLFLVLFSLHFLLCVTIFVLFFCFFSFTLSYCVPYVYGWRTLLAGLLQLCGKPPHLRLVFTRLSLRIHQTVALSLRASPITRKHVTTDDSGSQEQSYWHRTTQLPTADCNDYQRSAG